MQFDSKINADRPVPVLLGNGRLATMVGKTGFHDDPREWEEHLALLQEFVLAGRRLSGAHHPLVSFGTLRRTLWVDGEEPRILEHTQTLHTEYAELRTRFLYETVLESTKSCVLAHRNCFVAESRLSNHSTREVRVLMLLSYEFGERGFPEGIKVFRNRDVSFPYFEWETHDNLGVLWLLSNEECWIFDETKATLNIDKIIEPGEEVVIRCVLGISDRMEYQDLFSFEKYEEQLNKHVQTWRQFWAKSELSTGDEAVDAFREISLYTIASQATPWSIPPSLTHQHWGGGAFHDEYYPFNALLSGGHEDLAKRVPYFRLATLPSALQRGRGLGALYPWSSTENGEERDPHGHWYSERFHLGLIAACVWNLWLYDRKVETLEEFYPVLKQIARYFENVMLERDEKGALQTKACTDFDESVGQVSKGPFTMAAATFVFDRACEAARRLGVDREVRIRWDSYAKQLRQNFPVDLNARRYTIADGKPLHSSIIGYIVPFFCDDGSEFAKNSVKTVYEIMKWERGFRPGLNEVYEGTSWMWTAGHLGMCHGVLGNAEELWECLKLAPESAGQFLSPNEHINRDGQPVVPWFTTGCGAWLTALHWMFARVDDTGEHLLPAVPQNLRTFHFRGLRLSRGVSVAVRFEEGRLVYLSLTCLEPLTFTFDIPERFVADALSREMVKIVDLEGVWKIQVDLLPGENTLVEESPKTTPKIVG